MRGMNERWNKEGRKGTWKEGRKEGKKEGVWNIEGRSIGHVRSEDGKE